MKKTIYTILSIVSIAYIVFLVLDVLRDHGGWTPNLGWFEDWFDFIVRFGGIAIIFCFALVNFTGNPLKTVFFILLILAIVCYVIVLIVPDFFSNIFSKKEETEAAITLIRAFVLK